MKSKTDPNVYIIESLDFDDEDNDRFEGRALAEMLRLSGKNPIYRYVRTSQEFEHFFEDFCNSDYRYLHLSCHGSSRSIATSLSEILFDDLADIMECKLKGKRLFLSACEVVNFEFAEKIIGKSGCISIIGPSTKLYTNDALIFWASFYHFIFRENPSAMNKALIVKTLTALKKVDQGFKLKYFYRAKSGKKPVMLAET